MQHGAVLDVDPVPDSDGIYIASKHGVEPYAAFVAHFDVAHNGGVFGQETVAADFRGEPPYG